MSAPRTHDSVAAERCRCCGHAKVGSPCPRCCDTAFDLAAGERPLQKGRGNAALDWLRGFAETRRCVGQTLHHRAFVGKLRLPIATNLVAAVTLAIGAWMAWSPLRELFASPWPILDGWRQEQQLRGPFALLLTTIWFEVVGGGSLDQLVSATECAVAGPGMEKPARPSAGAIALRVHRRARMLATQLLLLPLAWIAALVPWIGLPAVFVGCSWLAATVWLELPAERRDQDPRVHQKDLLHNAPRALGFGAALQLAVLLPLVNVLLLAPIAAVAAAVVYLQFDRSPRPPA